MIKALENPNYKKILEYVNWQVRHTEAQSLEEALSMEAIKFGCELFNYGEAFCHARVVGNNCAGYQYLTVESVDSSNTNPIVIHLKEIGKNVQILGRPIDIEDILILLSKKAYSISIPCFASYIIVTILSRGIVTEYFISWQLGRYLHEQSEDTWIELSEFIKTREHVLTVDELPSQTH